LESLNQKEIKELFLKGRRIKGGDYLCIYRFNYLPYSKFGVSLKRKMGNAVVRNYEKRVIREIIRNARLLVPNMNVMIIKIAQTANSFTEKKKDIHGLFNHISKE
jgi:ribonuclease P protein component